MLCSNWPRCHGNKPLTWLSWELCPSAPPFLTAVTETQQLRFHRQRQERFLETKINAVEMRLERVSLRFLQPVLWLSPEVGERCPSQDLAQPPNTNSPRFRPGDERGNPTKGLQSSLCTNKLALY